MYDSFSKTIPENFLSEENGILLIDFTFESLPYFSFNAMKVGFLSFKLVTLIYLLCNSKPMYLIAAFPCLVDGWLWILYTIIGITVPILIYEIYNRMKKMEIKLWKTIKQ